MLSQNGYSSDDVGLRLLADCMSCETDVVDLLHNSKDILMLKSFLYPPKGEEGMISHTMRLFSNMATSTPFSRHLLLTNGIITSAFEIASRANVSEEVLNEAVYLLSNMTDGEDDQIETFLQQGVLNTEPGEEECTAVTILCRGLCVSDVRVVKRCLEGLENLLFFGTRKMESNRENAVAFASPFLSRSSLGTQERVSSPTTASDDSDSNVFEQMTIRCGGRETLISLSRILADPDSAEFDVDITRTVHIDVSTDPLFILPLKDKTDRVLKQFFTFPGSPSLTPHLPTRSILSTDNGPDTSPFDESFHDDPTTHSRHNTTTDQLFFTLHDSQRSLSGLHRSTLNEDGPDILLSPEPAHDKLWDCEKASGDVGENAERGGGFQGYGRWKRDLEPDRPLSLLKDDWD
ncbi:hypothetical protein BLNAU_8648 [Blattamonas nauphoetae]|uniref:Uncharacterized protein n=1 Tax=Blattamonas nauphoetae TaxID=2049346 RepID=A0ABQ9XY82_9EUKA|nr:hypothetical protein BLNAU_8648 [Blattamonas nauphoetae]